MSAQVKPATPTYLQEASVEWATKMLLTTIVKQGTHPQVLQETLGKIYESWAKAKKEQQEVERSKSLENIGITARLVATDDGIEHHAIRYGGTYATGNDFDTTLVNFIEKLLKKA